MIAPVDAVAQVRATETTGRVAIPPVPIAISNNSVVVNENRLSAPLANFDDGFSSDQGAFLSGAETEREVTPTTDREQSPADRTPIWELPRRMAAAASGTVQSPLSAAEEGGERSENLGGGEEDDEHGDIVKTAKITICPPKDLAAADEARASLLLHQHDSADMDADEASSPSSFPSTPITNTAPVASTPHQGSPVSRKDSNSPNSINQQLRQQYEIQAVSRPRPTTPVSACAIESFVAVNPRRTSDAEKMKISLPTSLFTASATEPQPDEPTQTNTGPGSQRMHRRRSSMSWSEFQENMIASSYHTASGTGSGRASGRTTPLSSNCVGDDQDLLEQNPFYQDRVPPSPVVHRRTSREWVDFEGVDNSQLSQSASNGEFQAPPLSELVTEIERTVNAWSQNDYVDQAAVTEGNVTGTEDVVLGDKETQGEQEQYAPPPAPSDLGYGTYAETSWDQKQATYGQVELQQQELPQEPFHNYGAYVATDQQQYTSYDNNTGYPAYELDSSYPPPPSPLPPAAPTSSFMDDWSSRVSSTGGAFDSSTSAAKVNAYDSSGMDNAASMHYAQPASISSVHDDWNDSPYAQLQLSYQQQQAPAEPTGATQVEGAGGEKAAVGAPSRSAPPPPRPPPTSSHADTPASTEEKEEKEDREDWLAFEKMTQKMNMVVKKTQEKLQEMQKETMANILPGTPYEVSIGSLIPNSYQQQSTSDKKTAVVSTPVGNIDLLSSDFEPSPPTAPVVQEQQTTQTPQSSSDSESAKEWKSIHEVLNEEIKKQKELQKPKRPPPPKAAPPRPPKPASSATATTTSATVLPSWDDAPVPSGAALASSTPAYPSWDDGAVAPQCYSQQSAVTSASATLDTFAASPPKHAGTSEAAPFTYEPATILAPTPASLSNVSPIDYSAKLEHAAFPAVTSSTAGVPGTGAEWDEREPIEKSIPFTKSDVANQNHLQWNDRPEDDALFNVSKYTGFVAGGEMTTTKADAAPVDDFDIFLKQEKPTSMPIVPPSAPPPPVPPPRSPGPERTFVIETTRNAQSASNGGPSSAAQSGWADFDTTDAFANGAGVLPPSESDFYLKMTNATKSNTPASVDPFAPRGAPQSLDLLGSVDNMDDSYDPFAVKSPEQIVAEAKAKAQAQLSAREANDDLDFFGGAAEKSEKLQNDEEDEADEKGRSSPGFGFRDDFAPPPGAIGAARTEDDEDESPLYDEDDSLPLLEFPPKFTGDGWDMMLRFPVKKKMMAERCWKPVYVRLQGANIELYYGKNDRLPFQTLPLLANYCLSDVTTQQYDIYGKIHTVKLQYVVYKEKVGIRPGQIPKLVEGHFTKLGLPLEHAAQTSILLKFGSLHHDDLQSFVYAVEDILFHIPAVRERPALYKQDEIQVHCYDEYASHINKDGAVSDQRARVRLFCLAFVSGVPFVEIGLNDRRRQGKEVVRRKDIMPMYTERWIRFEALEFHGCVDKNNFDKEHVIRMQPLDACFFEVLRFRVRPPRGKELPLQVRSIMKIAGSKIEIRIEAMVAVFKSRKANQVPCEDIQIRFPIPEAWIYLFREERHWGYGSVHAKVRRPGKVKNIRDKIMGIVQNTDLSLIEVAIGDAKYEHVYRALVWRIPRLPEKHHGAYKTHLLRCRFELSSFDLMPETFIPNCEVEYTMPMATVSHTVVRSVSLEQHEDPDKAEKWVRYLAKYQYSVEIDYVQTTDLDIEAIMDTTVIEPEKSLEKAPVKHQPSLDIGVAKEFHEGYRIDFSEAELGGGRYEKSAKGGRKSSSDSSDEDDARGPHKPPLIHIDIKNYQY